MWWVIFEGLDKSGKGTLEQHFLKATSYEHIVIDRGPVGYLVFDQVFGRETKQRKQNFIHQARKIMKSKDCMVVYCKVPWNAAQARLVDHNETCPYDYMAAQKMYDVAIRRFYNEPYVLTLDTTASIDECVKRILDKLDELSADQLS